MASKEAIRSAAQMVEEREARGRPPTTLQTLSPSVSGPRSTAVSEVADLVESGLESFDDDALAKRFVNQTSVSEGKPLPVTHRFALSLFGDNFGEQQAEFRNHYPEGELVEVPNTSIVLFRRSPSERFRKLDMGVVETMARGGIATETAGDLAEFAGGGGPQMIGEGLLGRGSGAFLRRILKMGAGAAAGEFARQGAQEARGTQQQSLQEVVESAAAEGAISIVGGTIGAAAGGAINLKRSRGGIIEPTEEGKRAFMAARKLREAGIPVEDPLPIQVTDVPAIRLLGRQAAALLPAIPRAFRRQAKQLGSAMRNLSDRRARSRGRVEAVRLIDDTSNRMEEALVAAFKHRTTSPREAGRLLRDHVTRWWEDSGRVVDGLYAQARGIAEPEFDLSPALAVARRLKRGVRGAGRIDPETGERLASVDVRNLPAVIEEQIRLLERLDPALPSAQGTSPAMDVLREMERNLSDLALPGPEGARLENRLAGELLGSIREVMESPRGTEEFRRAWRHARAAAARRFQTRESAAVVDLLGTWKVGGRGPDLTQIGEQLSRPGSFESLVVLARAGGNDTLQPVRNALKTKLAGDPFSITQKLDEFDLPTLRILMTKDEIRAYRWAGEQMDRLERSGIRKVAENQTRMRPFIDEIIDNPESASVDSLFEVVSSSGGRESPFGTSLRASILDNIWQRSHVVDRGFRRLDSDKLNRVLDDFSARGLLQFLTVSEKKIIRNIELIQRVADQTIDAGTSIQAAAAVAGARGVVSNPTAAAAALSTIVEAIGVGRLMVTDAGRKFLVGVGKTQPPKDTKLLQLLGAMAATTASQVHRSSSEVREIEKLESMTPASAQEESRR